MLGIRTRLDNYFPRRFHIAKTVCFTGTSAKPSNKDDNVAEEGGCAVPEDCPGLEQWCDVSDGQCKHGCDEQEDCPEGKICIVANHMCQC